MTSPGYSVTTRTILGGPGGAVVLAAQFDGLVRVIEDIHICLPSSPPETIVQVAVQQDGGFSAQLILNEDMGVAETGVLPQNYLQETGQWAVLDTEDVVANLAASSVVGVITLGMRVYRAGLVVVGAAQTRDVAVEIGGPVPAGQRWLLRDISVSQNAPLDPGPCPWSAGSASIGSQGQVAGTVIGSHLAPNVPPHNHLTPRIVLDEGETLIGQKTAGGDQLLSWRTTFFVLNPPLRPNPST